VVTVGAESGNNERGKKCQETQAGQAFQSLGKNCISFIGALAAGLTPPPCLNSMGLKNKKYKPMWEQKAVASANVGDIMSSTLCPNDLCMP